MHGRYKIIIVNREQRYRKTTRKGGIHNRKYRPMLQPVQTVVLLGAAALMRAVPDASPSPYFDPANPMFPRILEMHERTWARLLAKRPSFAARCDLFARVEIVRDGVRCLEDVPV